MVVLVLNKEHLEIRGFSFVLSCSFHEMVKGSRRTDVYSHLGEKVNEALTAISNLHAMVI